GGGISFNGTLDNLYVDNTAGGVAAGLITNQWVLPTNMTLTRGGEVDFDMTDTSQALNAKTWRFRNNSGSWQLATVNDAGAVVANIMNFSRAGVGQFQNKLQPGQDTGNPQSTCGIYAGSGVPNNSTGATGDFYFRGDVPGTAGSRIYIKSAGAWVALTP